MAPASANCFPCGEVFADRRIRDPDAHYVTTAEETPGRARHQDSLPVGRETNVWTVNFGTANAENGWALVAVRRGFNIHVRHGALVS